MRIIFWDKENNELIYEFVKSEYVMFECATHLNVTSFNDFMCSQVSFCVTYPWL